MERAVAAAYWSPKEIKYKLCALLSSSVGREESKRRKFCRPGGRVGRGDVGSSSGSRGELAATLKGTRKGDLSLLGNGTREQKNANDE
jgi:hypothetical protein